MGFDPSLAASAGAAAEGMAALLAAAAALFLAASAGRVFLFLFLSAVHAIAVRRRTPEGDDSPAPPSRGAVRFGLSFFFLCLSAGIAFLAAAFVYSLRLGIDMAALGGYMLAGAVLGLAVAAFPRTGGAALTLVALGSWALVALETAAWHELLPGSELARLRVYAGGDGGSFVGLSVPQRNAIPVEQNMMLPPGELRFGIDLLEIKGPLAALAGTRFYRLAFLDAGEERVQLPAEAGPLDEGSILGSAAAFLGVSRSRYRSGAFSAEDFARYSLKTTGDGSISLVQER